MAQPRGVCIAALKVKFEEFNGFTLYLLELAVGNIVRRVLRLIRDVYNSEVSIKSVPQKGRIYELQSYGGSNSITEMINELENMYVNIADQAMEHIHSNEFIMTVGKSRTVEMFLKAAAKKRKFSVVVAETSPTYLGHEMALSLSQAGIDTTVISDSAIFAVMSRVNKVIMGTHAVLANGGLISVSGTQMVATAAKHHSTPVVVCTGLYKLSPLYPYDEDSFNDMVAPDSVMRFDEGDLIDKVTLINPYYDYVSPELVNLFITNTGGHPPSYLYRLINENYDPEDTDI
ncbi:13573_t:CDS:2 [Funneliformis geosporum]|uniref:Translation initiation factor eIF2B subunit beta n=1 Tax=Funneliformis geosporum TaxID=1117311 RepID=A0A9W4SQU3_9GLOM|nr:13573_t:CDS:2 [Funneliformis geosporum]